MIRLQKFLIGVNAATVLAHVCCAITEDTTNGMALWFVLAATWAVILYSNYQRLQTMVANEEKLKQTAK